MSVSDIATFFTTSTRSENDATNKIREKVLCIISNTPKEFLEHVQFGQQWKIVTDAWHDALKKLAEETGISEYTSTQMKRKGGRKFNYDGNVLYYNRNNLVASRTIEFKKGGSKISDQPQFLSLQAKFPLFAETYDKYFYENYLEKYIGCDSGITQAKPSLEVYLKKVTSTKYNITPFFSQIKTREPFFQEEKNAVVNASITDYLTKYGKDIDLKCFSDKVKATQTDKYYLLWCNGKFCSDKISESEMCNIVYHSIKNGNVLEVKSGNTMYGLLLRWRNHKGILNPAWQISMKRLI
jgi:hypothetical protein